MTSEDDRDPVTADWLETVLPDVMMTGQRNYLHAWVHPAVRQRLVAYVHSESRHWVLSLDCPQGTALLCCPTRRHVRLICAAFGVPLTEVPA